MREGGREGKRGGGGGGAGGVMWRELSFSLLFSSMTELIGFSTDDFIGTRLRDYFHPADFTKLIPYEVMCK